ncbi:ATP-binding protein [Melittangium boletus]|uniref:histidine kinase n=1 Tax=Melittangium boletus DSM 14713 TaxID=1294270 RepID=A0A250IBA8_9BACT|nr:ATP-binding protein [Melittangium boletus]ATB29035.1 sensor histidine kinase [Melittangium boletus DSM 14713]
MRDAQAINLSWLLRLRWGALFGQLAIILGVHLGLGLPQRLGPLFATVAVGAASNAALGLWVRRRERPIPEGLTWAVMALDVVLLTVLLELSGGASNPFSALYLVHIALAAVVLHEGWTWALMVLAAACFGELFVGAPAHHHIHDMRRHLEGMWAAFALAAGFIVYFVQRVTRALAAREAELVAARAAAARHDKLTALATLAAGAAHELSTPLSTIAVVARELERHLARAGQETSSLEDVRLIREQVARCRDILARMASDAGASQGESLAMLAPAALVEQALEALPGRERVLTEVDPRAREERELVSAHSFSQVIRGVVKNALQASASGAPVRLGLVREPQAWRLTVEDSGAGMAPDVLARAGEPFFTTKAPGEGMGLGLFLTRALLDQLGGQLVLDSTPGQGTRVTLTWPAGGLRQSAALSPEASRVQVAP